jgi:hypothetical protein
VNDPLKIVAERTGPGVLCGADRRVTDPFSNARCGDTGRGFYCAASTSICECTAVKKASAACCS